VLYFNAGGNNGGNSDMLANADGDCLGFTFTLTGGASCFFYHTALATEGGGGSLAGGNCWIR